MRPGRIVGYARVSSRDQGERGTSLEEQQERLRQYATREGLADPSIRVEVESGSDEKYERREEMHALLAESRPGDLVLVTRVDRWSRDMPWAVSSVRKLVAQGVGWRSIDDGIDAATEHGDVTLGYLSLAADHERKRIRRRTVGARERLLEQGWWANGAVPFGYVRGKREDKRQLYLDPIPEDAELVRTTFRLSLSGRSLDDIREYLQVERPDRQWARSLVRDILRNRVYLGEVLAGSRWVPGKHAPIIDLATFVRVQDAKHARWKGGPRPRAEARTASWLVRGLTWCGACGARMRSVYSGIHDYLACSVRCGAYYVSVPAVDTEVSGLVLARLGDLRHELAAVPAQGAKAVDHKAARQKIEERRARAVRGYVDGVLSASDLETTRARLDAELAKIEASTARAAGQEASRDPKARRTLLVDLGHLEARWRRATVDSKREILGELATRILVERDRASRVEWREIAELVREQ